MNRKFSGLAFVFLAVGGYAAYGSVLIDDFFTTGQPLLQRTAPGDIGIPIASTIVGPGILGGERDVRVDLISGANGTRISVVIATYDHSQDVTVKGTSMVAWDGIDGNGLVVNPIGLGGVDLTEGGLQDALEVRIVAAEPNAKLVYEVFTNAGNSSKYTLSLPVGAVNEVRVIPYSSFAINLGAGANFTNVGAITMMIDGSAVPSLDVILDTLQTTATLTMTKTDAHFIDVDGDGLVDIGDTIRYTVTIVNPDDDGNAAVPGVVFTDTPPAGTSLVAGSVVTSQGVVTLGNTGGDTAVAVNVGNIADAATVTITFDAVVNTNGPPKVCNQGFVVSGYLNLPSDDPDTLAELDPTCTPISYCGDGILDPNDEQCDDGNTNNNDACTNACTIARCGDGIVQTGVEQCDDGNTNNNDACTNACTIARCGDGIVETGVEECDDGNASNNDACLNTCLNARCGDGFVETGVEQCDDGNTNNNDACTNACTTARCGDGIVETGVEECDDGNANNNDACTNACTIARCGDGIVETGVEQCDDGNTNNNDACTNACTIARCGDGIVETGVEQCDDGNTNNNDACTNACTIARCGDGIVETGVEECDDGNTAPGDGCSPFCKIEVCGNNIIDPGEQCDGTANAPCNGEPCRADCTCQPLPPGPIPTVSEWGLLILALLLLTGAKLCFGRGRDVASA